MRRFLSAISLLLAFFAAPTFLVAEVSVPQDIRVPNKDPGYCAWCSLQTLAKAIAPHYPDDKALHRVANDLVAIRSQVDEGWEVRIENGVPVKEKVDPGSATPAKVRKQFRTMKVAYAERPDDRNHDVDFLRLCCKEGRGAMVGMHNWPAMGDSHAIAVVNISDEKETFQGKASSFQDYAVYFIDSNATKKVYRAGLTWFRKYWTGWLVSFEPQGKRVAVPTPEIKKEIREKKAVAGLPEKGEKSGDRLPEAKPRDDAMAEDGSKDPPLRGGKEVVPPVDNKETPPLSEAARSLAETVILSGMSRSDAEATARRLTAPPRLRR